MATWHAGHVTLPHLGLTPIFREQTQALNEISISTRPHWLPYRNIRRALFAHLAKRHRPPHFTPQTLSRTRPHLRDTSSVSDPIFHTLLKGAPLSNSSTHSNHLIHTSLLHPSHTHSHIPYFTHRTSPSPLSTSHTTSFIANTMAFVSTTVVLRPSIARPALSATTAFGSPVLRTATTTATPARISMTVLPRFTKAMDDYKSEFPAFAERGWGASVKAERWNGRHAMFGFLAMWITAYCKGHNLLPDPSVIIDPAQWGTLAALGDGSPIPVQRAVILIAHVHVLFVSIAAAISPFSFQDKLLLEPGEKDEEPAGLFPKFSLGLTKDAELWNSRVAMLGIICLVGQAVATKTPILDVLNTWFGKILF